MKLLPSDRRSVRVRGAMFATTLVMSTLLTAFFQVQVTGGERYLAQAESNRLRPIPIPAPRGDVLDRHGEIVATSVPGYAVLLLPGGEVEAVLRDLRPFLGLSSEEVEALRRRRAARPHDLLTVTEDATFAQVAALEERRASFPGLVVVDRPKRLYPAGAAVGHLIGYVAEITREELELPRYREAGYRQGRRIGKAGIEEEYELRLAGRDGARFVEVDAMGRIVDPRSEVGALPPTPGRDLRLTLDLRLQAYVASIFPDSMKGALVAMVPSTGEILAIYSNPSYDPNDFVDGVEPGVWRALSGDPDRPLLHRAVAALYPPASPWKLATAAAGLELDLVRADTHMPIACTGGMAYAGRYARCWWKPGHGDLDLVGAIEHSCNVYFYQLGARLGLRRLIEAGTRMGFHARTGVDLSGEAAGIFPRGVEWWRERMGYDPMPSEVMSLSIGQGPNSQTVLKMAHFFSALAGNGRAPAPHLAVLDSSEVWSRPGALALDFTPEDLRAMWAGLAGVTSWSRGGTARLAALERWKLYGKTGTGQNPHGEDHAWFAGFAGPADGAPEIAVAVIVEHGASGSDVAPLAAKAASFYLDRRHGFPFDPRPTLYERMEDGRVDWSALR